MLQVVTFCFKIGKSQSSSHNTVFDFRVIWHLRLESYEGKGRIEELLNIVLQAGWSYGKAYLIGGSSLRQFPKSAIIHSFYQLLPHISDISMKTIPLRAS